MRITLEQQDSLNKARCKQLKEIRKTYDPKGIFNFEQGLQGVLEYRQEILYK